MTSELPPDFDESLPPPPPPGPRPSSDLEVSPPPKREPWLRRSATDRYLSGVAGGLGERLQFDPLLVRVGLVGATTFLAYAGQNLHPLIMIPYFAAWAIIPPAEGRSLLARFREREAIQELLGAFVLLVIGLLVLADTKYAVAVGLGAIALALFSDRNSDSKAALPATATATAPLPPPPDSSEGATTQPISRGLFFGRNLDIGERAAGLFATRHRRPARREPALWPLTLSLLVLLAIVAILIDRFTDPGMDPRIVLDLALLAIGSVLLLSYWRGRAGVTILWALALLPLWMAFSIADVGRFSGEGSVFHVVEDADLAPEMSYEHGYGDLTIDLRQVELPAGSETRMAIGITAGRASLIVPRDVTLKVQGKVGLGRYSLQSPPFWYHSADLANGRIDRTFGALGLPCFHNEASEEGLRDMASRSGVAISSDADVITAIESAGYGRPQFSFTGQNEEWFETADGGENIRYIDTDYYVVQTGNDGTLCLPKEPPSNPATLIIEPTIGIGTLEISRVDN